MSARHICPFVSTVLPPVGGDLPRVSAAHRDSVGSVTRGIARLVCVALGLVLSAAQAHAQPRLTQILPGPLPAGVPATAQFYATDLNDSGEVVFTMDWQVGGCEYEKTKSGVWRDGVVRWLGGFGTGLCISEAGEVGGGIYLCDGLACVWTVDGTQHFVRRADNPTTFETHGVGTLFGSGATRYGVGTWKPIENGMAQPQPNGWVGPPRNMNASRRYVAEFNDSGWSRLLVRDGRDGANQIITWPGTNSSYVAVLADGTVYFRAFEHLYAWRDAPIVEVATQFSATDVNDLHVAVGASSLPGHGNAAALFHAGRRVLLRDMPPSTAFPTLNLSQLQLRRLNNAGQIIASWNNPATGRQDYFLVEPGPLVTTAPSAGSAAAGGQVSLTSAFFPGCAGETTQYRWFRSGSTLPLVDGPLPSGAIVSGATTPTLVLTNVTISEAGDYIVRATNPCGTRDADVATVTITPPPTCDTIDFNQNGVFPEDQDVVDFFNVLAGGSCPACNDIDFNNNTVFPEDQDVIDFFNVLAGGTCP